MLKTNLPKWHTYCDNTTAINALCFTYGNTTIYYSYQTPVAFEVDGVLTVRVNEWGNTTGKHINAIDGGNNKGARIMGAEFESRLQWIMDESWVVN